MKCKYCSTEAVKEARIIVDADPDFESGGMTSVWGNVWLCEEHLQDWEEKEGIFEPYYGGE